MKKKKQTLAIIKDDPWLEPFEQAIEGRHQDAVRKMKELTGGKHSLSDFANAYNYYGLHRQADGSWVLREWAPSATEIYVIGEPTRSALPRRFRAKAEIKPLKPIKP